MHPSTVIAALIGAALVFLAGCAEEPSAQPAEDMVPDEAVASPPASGAAAEASDEGVDQELPAGLVVCVEPRPEICTREYRPVCALQRETAAAGKWVTRPNACDACTDPEVIGHRPGACDAEGPLPQTMLDY